VKLKKGYFLGRDALLKAQNVTERKLCCLTFDDPDAVALGREPLLVDGRVLGYVTSANHGYSVGKYILYGYLPHEYASPRTKSRCSTSTVAIQPLLLPNRFLIPTTRA
jgi:glycine cleavage system aminomethyltransferase T